MSTKAKKDTRFNIRVDEDVRLEFHAAAAVDDQQASWLLHRFIAQTIRRVKQENPERFAEELARLRAEEGEEEPVSPKKNSSPAKTSAPVESVDLEDTFEITGEAPQPDPNGVPYYDVYAHENEHIKPKEFRAGKGVRLK